MKGCALLSFLLCAGAFLYSCSDQNPSAMGAFGFLSGFFMVVTFVVFSEGTDRNRPA